MHPTIAHILEQREAKWFTLYEKAPTIHDLIFGEWAKDHESVFLVHGCFTVVCSDLLFRRHFPQFVSDRDSLGDLWGYLHRDEVSERAFWVCQEGPEDDDDSLVEVVLLTSYLQSISLFNPDMVPLQTLQWKKIQDKINTLISV